MPPATQPEDTAAGASAATSDPALPRQIDEMIGDLSSKGGVSAKSADFAELDPTPQGGNTAALDNLLDVTVVVTAELGRATTSIGQLLKLNVGSVVELERPVSDPVDLMAQGVRLARGEVVVVDDRFAIRIQEIVDPKKRM